MNTDKKKIECICGKSADLCPVCDLELLPKQKMNTNNLRKEFEDTFIKVHRILNHDENITLLEDVWNWINQTLKDQKDKLEEKYAHPTNGDWCCACDYDIAVMKSEIKEAKKRFHQQGYAEGFTKGMNQGYLERSKDLPKSYQKGVEDNEVDFTERLEIAIKEERVRIKEKIKGMIVPDDCCSSDSCADHRFAVGVNSTLDDILKNLEK